MKPVTVTIEAVRPAEKGETYLAINVEEGIAAVSTWMAENPTSGPALIVRPAKGKVTHA